MFSLQGKTAVITGGGKGIGAVISASMGRAGANIVITGRDLSALEQHAVELASEGIQVLALRADLRDAVQVKGIVDQTIDRFGQIDCWVNNAGGASPEQAKDLLSMDETDWDSVLDLNLRSPFLCCKAAAQTMAGHGGSIINVTSGSALVPNPNMAHYGAAKAALENLTASMALEWGHLGIRVNAVRPGVIDTSEKRGKRGEGWLAAQAARTPLGVNGTPRDIGAACVFLGSDEAGWITGSVLAVDGGVRIPLGHEEYMREHPKQPHRAGTALR